MQFSRSRLQVTRYFDHSLDPLAPDALHPRHLQAPVFHGDECDIRFGLNDAARPHMIWILKRSPDLMPGSFVEVYRYDGPSGVATVQPGFGANTSPGPYFIVTDQHPPDPCAYYRFEAIFVPPAP